jgi:hypothetical protein
MLVLRLHTTVPYLKFQDSYLPAEETWLCNSIPLAADELWTLCLILIRTSPDLLPLGWKIKRLQDPVTTSSYGSLAALLCLSVYEVD